MHTNELQGFFFVFFLKSKWDDMTNEKTFKISTKSDWKVPETVWCRRSSSLFRHLHHCCPRRLQITGSQALTVATRAAFFWSFNFKMPVLTLYNIHLGGLFLFNSYGFVFCRDLLVFCQAAFNLWKRTELKMWVSNLLCLLYPIGYRCRKTLS